MSAAASAPTDLPLPAPADRVACTWRLLFVVRRLIDYGRHLAASLREGSSAADLANAIHAFGTRDIGLILARITRGLLRAAALEADLGIGKARLCIAGHPIAASTPRPQRAPRPAAAPGILAAAGLESPLALMPTAAWVAAEIRRRPVGAVIADICRDLGIMPDHPLWRDIRVLVIRHGGSLARLTMDILRRASIFFAPTEPPAALDAPPLPGAPAPRPDGTGPP